MIQAGQKELGSATAESWATQLLGGRQHSCWEADNVAAGDQALRLLSWVVWLLMARMCDC